MVQYFKDEYQGNIYLYELDDDLYCLRAIFITTTDIFNTNLSIEQSQFFLPEGSFEDRLEHLLIISKEEFQCYWKLSISSHISRWNSLKAKLNIGQKMNTQIVCFYPQGVIVNFKEDFYGLANYEDCLSILGSKHMYPHQHIELFIDHFDDENLWVNFIIAQA